MVSTNLAKIAGLKCLAIPKETYQIWYEQIKSDLKDNKIRDVKNGFDNLLKEKCYGGLDYSVFFDGAKENKQIDKEVIWQQVWKSAIHNGELPITARAAKVLNSLGGMEYIKNSDPDKMNWTRKEFLDIYEFTPEPFDNNFRCLGLNAEILMPSENILEIEG